MLTIFHLFLKIIKNHKKWIFGCLHRLMNANERESGKEGNKKISKKKVESNHIDCVKASKIYIFCYLATSIGIRYFPPFLLLLLFTSLWFQGYWRILEGKKEEMKEDRNYCAVGLSSIDNGSLIAWKLIKKYF